MKKMITGFYDLKKFGISQSAMKTFMSCRRKWMMNIAGLEKKDKQKNTHFGTIVHEMLDQVYQKLDKLPQDKIEKFVRQRLNQYLKKHADEIFVGGQQYEMEKEMCVAITTAYFDFFKRDRKNFTEMIPEQEFAIPYKGVTLRGKIDGLLRLKKKGRWQMEHKTKSRWDEESGLTALQFDFQNLMYSFAADTLSDEPVKGVLYNVIRKPGLRMKQDEGPKEFLDRVKADIASRPEWYFMRYEIVYTKKEKANFKEQLDGIIGELKMFCDGKLPDVQNQAHCLFPFRCEFLNVCASGNTHGLRIRESIHPELDADFAPDPRILERYDLDTKNL